MNKNFITKIEIDKLWDRYKVSWDLNSDVNILIGKNGTGKSTILDLIQEELKRGIWMEGSDYNTNISCSSEIKIIFQKLETQDYPKYISINTFDMELNNKKAIENYENNTLVKTELDVILYELIRDFKLLQLKLKNKVEKENNEIDKKITNLISNSSENKDDLLNLKKLVQEKKEKVKLIYSSKDKFESIMNNLFANTNKVLELDEDNSIVFRCEDIIISPYQLSSGEKQILMTFLKILLQEDKSFTLLMDEPEVSLHVEWQKNFIDNLISLNPNMQIIIATHSPAIVSQGWQDKIINTSDIVSKI